MTLILSGTNGVSDVNGSAATPALRGTDADSGIYINSANEPNASINGTAVWSAASTFGFKNRILNGSMVIDQRNNGAASSNAINGFFVDRWFVAQTITGKLIAQQNAGAVTLPAGFVNYLGVTSQSAYSVGAGDFYVIGQPIEANNVSDFGWGTSNAQTVTLSFQVRSSLTGTFGGVVKNYAGTRSYPFTYTINAANTWEQKTITIAGDTSGSWVMSGNGGSIYVQFGLGIGSTFSGPAGSWASANYQGASGATSVVGTNGATFYITGVQLEKGSTATSFDYRPYGTELALCQRYYYQVSAGVSNANNSLLGPALAYSATSGLAWVNLPVSSRLKAPSSVVSSGVTVVANSLAAVSGFGGLSVNTDWSNDNNASLNFIGTGMSTTQPYSFVLGGATTSYVGLSWEL